MHIVFGMSQQTLSSLYACHLCMQTSVQFADYCRSVCMHIVCSDISLSLYAYRPWLHVLQHTTVLADLAH